MSVTAATEPAAYAADRSHAADATPARDVEVLADAPHGFHVPRDTTPTYEQELLVSGIVLLALFQLPGVFAAAAHRYGPHFASVGATVLVDGARFVATAAVYALATCFVVHLALRGFWVALVGTDSIFPHGVRWDRARDMGPVSTELVRERYRDLRHYIGWFDNAATVVFTCGFLAAAYIASGLVGILVAVGAVSVLLAVAPGAPPWAVVLAAVVLTAPLAVLPIVDLTLAKRWPPASGARRLLRAAMRPALSLSPPSVGATSRVLATNVDKRAVYGLLGVAMLGAYAGARLADDGSIPGAGAYRFFDGASESRGVVAAFYDDQRGSGPRDPALPSIPAQVIGGPYARLFVPYVPRAHNDALPRTCPGLRAPRSDPATGEDTTALAAIVACAARVHRIALDGQPLANVRLRLFEDPVTERRGFLAQIPVSTLAPGEHSLTVWPATRNGRPPARTPWTITFWR